MISFDKFSLLPVKVRVILIKSILNDIGYKLDVSGIEDKQYKKALKKFQIDNGFVGNCMINDSLYNILINSTPNSNNIWKNIKNER